jgi:hypothetical protein
VFEFVFGVQASPLSWPHVYGTSAESVQIQPCCRAVYYEVGPFSRQRQAVARIVRSDAPGRETEVRWLGICGDDGRPTLPGWFALGDAPERNSPLARISCAADPRPHDPDSARLRGDHVEGAIGELVDGTLLQRELGAVQVVRDGHVLDETDVPLEVLREAVSNALTHRSLSPATSPRRRASARAFTITALSRTKVTLTSHGTRPAGPVLFQLPAFLHNVAATSTGMVDEVSGTVTISPRVRHVTVTSRHTVAAATGLNASRVVPPWASSGWPTSNKFRTTDAQLSSWRSWGGTATKNAGTPGGGTERTQPRSS